MGQIIIVDEQDNVIGYKERGTLDLSDMYRVSALWITNTKGDVLLAQRAFTKKHHPGKWGPAVAGTVEKGETYESNIMKEAEEEIGLKDMVFTPYKKVISKSKYKHFTQWFVLQLDKDISFFTKQDDEVEALQGFSKDVLKEELQKNSSHFLQSIHEDYLLCI